MILEFLSFTANAYLLGTAQGASGAGGGEGRERVVRAGVMRCGAAVRGGGEVWRDTYLDGDWSSSVTCFFGLEGFC